MTTAPPRATNLPPAPARVAICTYEGRLKMWLARVRSGMHATSGPALKPHSPWVRQGIYASAAPSSLDQKELENMRDSAPEAASTDDGLNVPSAVQGQCVLKSRGPHGHAPSSKTREEPVSWAERHNTRGPLPPPPPYDPRKAVLQNTYPRLRCTPQLGSWTGKSGGAPSTA